MKRRRLLAGLVAIALVTLGAIWLLSDGLSARERALVGRWRIVNSDGGGVTAGILLTADRRVERQGGPPSPLGEPPIRWSLQGDRLVYDAEPDAFRRFLRPAAPYLGLRVNGAMSYRIDFAGDRLVFHQPNGSQIVWERIDD